MRHELCYTRILKVSFDILFHSFMKLKSGLDVVNKSIMDEIECVSFKTDLGMQIRNWHIFTLFVKKKIKKDEE